MGKPEGERANGHRVGREVFGVGTAQGLEQVLDAVICSLQWTVRSCATSPARRALLQAQRHRLSRTLAWELGPDGILINVIITGFTETERNRERMPQDLRDRVAAATPLRRLSSPEDVAPLAVFLGSTANANITGEIVAEGSSTAHSMHAAVL